MEMDRWVGEGVFKYEGGTGPCEEKLEEPRWVSHEGGMFVNEIRRRGQVSGVGILVNYTQMRASLRLCIEKFVAIGDITY